ncbi:hypothetical protein BCR34DRAFT_473350 [Clohesyomyces aquaticus]|uniref:Uncharacterized protein n=1 Tax=Clohesyomyces aquaticus TaxID=1231657 RepID=A0A1Y2A7S3_9PLEO|nr:hypothetical protein BCR34DRAFT_473350 [Clohesyomyces aquaticus]
MGDANPQSSSHLLPSHALSDSDSLFPTTPSGLTPNTRSEAEAALSHNALTQTESAAPTTPLPPSEAAYFGATQAATEEDDIAELDDAKKAYRRPKGPIRTSSTNYERALREVRMQQSAASDISAGGDATSDASDPTMSSVSASSVVPGFPLPAPGQGVVPLQPMLGSGQADALKRVRPTGLSLGELGRAQSWSEQDRRHVYTAGLLTGEDGESGDAKVKGYGSGASEGAAGV